MPMSAFAQLVKRSDGIIGRTEAASFLVRNDDGVDGDVLLARVEFSRKGTFRGAIPAEPSQSHTRIRTTWCPLAS